MQKLNSRGKLFLHAAEHANHNNISPMHVLDSALLPVVFLPEDYVRNI